MSHGTRGGGYIVWKGRDGAIEIINKHKPKWAYMQDSLNYLVFLIKAEDILKRVDNTPVYITSLMGRRCWS